MKGSFVELIVLFIFLKVCCWDNSEEKIKNVQSQVGDLQLLQKSASGKIDELMGETKRNFYQSDSDQRMGLDSIRSTVNNNFFTEIAELKSLRQTMENENRKTDNEIKKLQKSLKELSEKCETKSALSGESKDENK